MLDSQFYSNFFTIDGYAIVRLLHLDLQNSGGFLQEEYRSAYCLMQGTNPVFEFDARN